MAEVSKIPRAVEMPPVKRAAFVNLIKTCNGATTKEGSIYMSKESTLLDRDIEREMRKCSQLDSGLTNAIMLLYGRPDLGNIDYGSLDISKPKDQGIIMELHSVLNEDKLSEAISLAEEIINTEDIPGVKGVLSNGIENIKKHLQAFRTVWQEYQNYAKPLVKKPLVKEDKRLPRSEIESKFASNANRLDSLGEEVKRKKEDVKRLEDRIMAIGQENVGFAALLGETKEKVEKVFRPGEEREKEKPAEAAVAEKEAKVISLDLATIRILNKLDDMGMRRLAKDLVKNLPDILSALPRDDYEEFADLLRKIVDENRPPVPPKTPAATAQMPEEYNEAA